MPKTRVSLTWPSMIMPLSCEIIWKIDLRSESLAETVKSPAFNVMAAACGAFIEGGLL